MRILFSFLFFSVTMVSFFSSRPAMAGLAPADIKVGTCRNWFQAGPGARNEDIEPMTYPRKDFDDLGSARVGECSMTLAHDEGVSAQGLKRIEIYTLSEKVEKNGFHTCFYMRGPGLHDEQGVMLLACQQKSLDR